MQARALAYAASAAAFFATGALAQPVPTGAAPSQSGSSSDAARPQSTPQTLPPSSSGPQSTLSEVVVTAQQRTENLQKTAVAVDVVKGSELVASGVTNVETLTKLVPALAVEPTANGSLIFIRGVGNFTFQASADPASAFNYDGVYVARPAANAGTFYDLQRIEVLKGPQGTLYGRNATAGAINVLPVQPMLNRYGFYETTSFGNYGSVTTEGALNIPIGETAALRISGSYDLHDGYLADGTSSEDSGGARIQFKDQLTPDLTIRLSTDYAHQGGTGPGGNYIGTYALVNGRYVSTPSNISPSEGLYSAPDQAFRQSVLAGTTGRNLGPFVDQQFQDNTFYGANAQIDYRTPLGTITVLPAWREVDKNNFLTATGYNFGDVLGSDQYSIEARFVSNPGKIIDYILGVYYFDEHLSDRQSASTQAIATFTNVRSRTSSPAVYGRLTYHLTDRLRLTGGIRYTDDNKSFNSASQTLASICVLKACPTAVLFPYTTTLAQQPYVPAMGARPVPVGPGNLIARVDGAANVKSNKDKVTYRAAAEYDLAPRSLLYVSFETGYRSGGFNTAAGFNTFNPETITAYTVGVKNRFFDNRVQLNVEAFDWEYKNQQLSLFGADAAGRPTVITQNVGQSTIRGVELEGQVLLTSHTVLSADIQYLDARYNSFLYRTVASPTSPPPFTGCSSSLDPANSARYINNCAGKPLFNAPEWTLNAGIQHTVPLSSYEVVFSVNTQYRSGRYTDSDYINEEYQRPTTQTDAQVSLTRNEAPWTISLFVHNLEDYRYLVYAAPTVSSNLIIGDYAPPRTYGVRVSTKF